MARTFVKQPTIVKKSEIPKYGVSLYHHQNSVASLNMQNTSDSDQADNATNKLQTVTLHA